MLPLGTLRTTAGDEVEVIAPGMYNRTDAGPDFFNAKVKVGGVLWVGNVELHTKASDWYRHRHDSDAAYDNVILHVVEEADMDVTTSQGKVIPTLVLPVPKRLRDDYTELLHCDRYPPCHKIIPTLPALKTRSWLAALQTERLERKTRDITSRVERMHGSWEDAYFFTIARDFGFGINGDAFDTWAQSLPLRAVDHHRDNLFQVESIFLGQAGLLDRVDERYRKEYAYLQRKFGLQPMDTAQWRYLRTRPQNFPHVRLTQLARLHHEHRTGLSALLACKDVKGIARLYEMKGTKLALMVINTAVPTIFAYGRHHAKEELCDLARDLLEQVKAENNNIVRMWAECGLSVTDAGESQALIQLKTCYCDTKNCLRCRFGYEFLTSDYRQGFLSEDTAQGV